MEGVLNITSRPSLNLTTPLDSDRRGDTPGQSIVLSMDKELSKTISMAIELFVNPYLSLFGIVGNVYSAVFLFRSGLKKSSNVLLFCTAISDAAFLVAKNNIPSLVFRYGSKKLFPEPLEGLTFFGAWLGYSCLNQIFTGTSLFLPTLMVAERLVAIFFPLHVHLIITPKRMWTACFLIGVVSFSFTVGFYCRWYWLGMYHFASINMSFAILIQTGYKDMAITVLNDYIINNTTGSFSILVVTIGSVVIGVKVVLSVTQRQKLAAVPQSKKDNVTSRTTRTLLTFCVVYSVTAGSAYVISNFEIFFVIERYLSYVLDDFRNLTMIINCSSNFIIHFLTNPNFRGQFKLQNFRCRQPGCSCLAKLRAMLRTNKDNNL